jgi:methyltransferase
MVAAYAGLLALVAVERIAELRLSRRNAEWALSRGGIELGSGQMIWMKLVHTSFFFSCILEVLLLDRPFLPWLGFPMLAASIAAQALRYSAIAALGLRWNVRVIVVPGMAAVATGPYRFLRHPNYLAVVLEMFAIPLVHTAVVTAAVFSALNLFLLRARIRLEESALDRYCPFA